MVIDHKIYLHVVTVDRWQTWRSLRGIGVNVECTMAIAQRLNLTRPPEDSTLDNYLAEVSKLTQEKCWRLHAERVKHSIKFEFRNNFTSPT